MRLYNYLNELGLQTRKTFQERYAETQKKLQALQSRKQEVSKKSGSNRSEQLKKISLSIEVLRQKLRLMQAQQNKKEQNV